LTKREHGTCRQRIATAGHATRQVLSETVRVSDIKRSFCLGAVGQIGGVVGGLITVVILSIISPRNFFDSPIRIAVFTTACGLIGGIAAFSAAISLAVSKSLLFSIPTALGACAGLCTLFKIVLSPAGVDSPIGKLFTLVTVVITVCRVVIGWKAKRPRSDQEANAAVGHKPRRPSLGPMLTRAVRAGAGTAFVLLGVLMAVLAGVPILNISHIDGWGIILYVLLGFILGCIISLGEPLCTRASRRVESLRSR